MALVVKKLLANARGIRDMCFIPGLGRSLEKEMETRSSMEWWEIPWSDELSGLQSWGHKELDMT